jgi:hypothetical protein
VPYDDWDTHYYVTDNLIHDIGIEFRSAIAIFAGYVGNATIAHNTIQRMPYTAIQVTTQTHTHTLTTPPLPLSPPLTPPHTHPSSSPPHIQVGWGWGQDSFGGNNRIMNNSIDGVLAYFADGGCIYAQSNMHGSEISGNWLQHDGNRYGVIYTDGATNVSVTRNVMNGGEAPCVFLHGGNTFHVADIYYNNTHNASLCCGAVPEGAPWPAHELGSGEAWPAEAQAIIDNAGRR